MVKIHLLNQNFIIVSIPYTYMAPIFYAIILILAFVICLE
jgi:hypothetical protein